MIMNDFFGGENINNILLHIPTINIEIMSHYHYI